MTFYVIFNCLTLMLLYLSVKNNKSLCMLCPAKRINVRKSVRTQAYCKDAFRYNHDTRANADRYQFWLFVCAHLCFCDSPFKHSSGAAIGVN